MTIIRIIQLYPKSMNLYGDCGNTLTLKKRLEWRGIETEIIDHNIGDRTDFSKADIIIGGGGQDSQQDQIQKDLLIHRLTLSNAANQGTPILLVCGMYQLFGRTFITEDNNSIEGLGILAIDTKASQNRLTGNIIVESQQFGYIVGYENHSGQTFLDESMTPIGRVVLGAGNNSAGDYEGVVYQNIIATYMHGPVLPRNPQIAEFLIAEALKNKGIDDPLKELPIDNLAYLAQQDALGRKR